MPRDNQGRYQVPVSAKAVPNTTIRSGPYNELLADLEQDANEARPVTAGGTGATSAENARQNLGIDDLVDGKVNRAGDRMTGSLSSAVKDHGTLVTVTEEFKYTDGNTHRFTCNGTVTINPTGLAEGDVLQVNFLYQSGSIAVSGTTQWELGATQKGTSISQVGAVLAVGASYCIIFEIRAGIRTAVFQ